MDFADIKACYDVAQNAFKNWHSYQNADELEIALRVVKKFAPKVIVEIGIANGASLASWAEIAKPDIAIGIDPLNNPKTMQQEMSLGKLIHDYNLKIIPHIDRAPEAHEKLIELLDGRKIDFLFIDAEHRYDDVRYDYYEYVKYLNHPSIVGFHDVYFSEHIFDSGSQVSALWERLKRQNIDYDEIHFHSTMGIGILHIP